MGKSSRCLISGKMKLLSYGELCAAVLYSLVETSKVDYPKATKNYMSCHSICIGVFRNEEKQDELAQKFMYAQYEMSRSKV